MCLEHEQASQRLKDWNEVDGENYKVDSRDILTRPHTSLVMADKAFSVLVF